MDHRRHDGARLGCVSPGRTGPGSFGYGYLIWLLPGTRRAFAFISDYGQRIFVDPPSKLVMVQTALETPQNEVFHLWSALVEQLG
jgi:CubicO group peptidase (beta-lactamase class C family)